MSARGVVTAVDCVSARVDVDGAVYDLPYRAVYEPVVGDVVDIDPVIAVIQGKSKENKDE